MTTNRAASVRARLRQHSDAIKQDFNLILTQYGLERLLYRALHLAALAAVSPQGRAAVPAVLRRPAPAYARYRLAEVRTEQHRVHEKRVPGHLANRERRRNRV